MREDDELAVSYACAREMNVPRAFTFGFVHQPIRALNQLARQAPRGDTTLGDTSEPQADDPDIDTHRLRLEPCILGGPREAFDSGSEALGHRIRLVRAGKIADEETELVAAETCV
ncbi:MAG: hypothetical protein QM736_19705 [Vicinamibacterales bacterium]